MAACKVQDQLSRSSIPSGFEELLNDLVRSIITSQPLDLMEHIADYFEALVDRRTLWDMQLEYGKQRKTDKAPISNAIKSETDKTETNDTQPDTATPKRLNNATQNSPCPKSQNYKVCCSVEAKPKEERPVSVQRKPIRNRPARQKDAWTDGVVLASHLAQHEALRQVIKEIGETNEQIITLEETAGNTAPRPQKARNTAQARELAEKHSSLKSALDKMMLICNWIKSNELSDERAPEVRKNLVEKTTRREKHANDVNNNLQASLENQMDALKDTMEHIQEALAIKHRGGTTKSSAQVNALSNVHATGGPIATETRDHQEDANVLNDITKLNQWLQQMFQMRSDTQQVTVNLQGTTSTDRNVRSKSTQKSKTKRQQETVTTVLESKTADSQNILVVTDTTEAKKVSPKKENLAAENTSSESIHSNTNSSTQGKQVKASTARQPPANQDGAPQKGAHIKLEYHVNETDRKKDTHLMLMSTISRETATAREATQINFKSVAVVEAKTPQISDLKEGGATDTGNSKGAEKAQRKAKPVLASQVEDSRRGSIPVPLRKRLQTTPIQPHSSEPDLARKQPTGTETPNSQTTNDESNVANIDSYSAVPNLPMSHESMTTSSYVNVFCVQSTSSVSQNSWYPHDTTTAKAKEKHETKNYDIQNNDERIACEQLISKCATPTTKTKATQKQTGPQKADKSPQPSVASGSIQAPISMHSAASNQPTNEQVLSNEVLSVRSINSPSYATAQLSVQKADLSTIKKENDEKQNSAESFPKASSHSTARSAGSQKGNTAKPSTEIEIASSSFAKSSGQALATQRGETSPSPKDATSDNTSSACYKRPADQPPTTSSTHNTDQPNSSLNFLKSPSHSTTPKSSPQKADESATKPTTDQSSNELASNVYSSTSFLKSSSHKSTNSSHQKVETAKPAAEPTTPKDQTVYSDKSFVSSHSTANSDPVKGDAGPSSNGIKRNSLPIPKTTHQSNGDRKKGDASSSSKETAVIPPQANGSAPSSLVKIENNSAAKLSNKEIEIASSSFAKSSGQALATQEGETSPSSKDASSDQPPTTSSAHNADATTQAANTEKVQSDADSSPSFTKPPSSHSMTKSGTQKATAAESLNDQKESPRFVEYTNIFPQISQMRATPESSNTAVSKQQLISASTQSINKQPQTAGHNKGGIASAVAPSIERVKIQPPPSAKKKPETEQKTETTKKNIHAEDPVENAFSKVSSIAAPSKESTKLDKASIHSTSTKQADAPSKESAKLDKASIHSTSTNQADAPSKESAKLDKASIHSTSTNQADAPSKESAKLDKASIHSTSTKQADAPSKESAKLDKASIQSASASATNSNKHLPTGSHNSVLSNKDSGKGGTDVGEHQVTAKSNNNNARTHHEKGQHGKITKAASSTEHQSASQVSLQSFRMPEDPIKEVNESETSE